MAQWAYENGYWKERKGALHDLIPAVAQAWGLDVVGYQAEAASGHFIILRGLDEDGKVVVADPSSRERSEVSWDFHLIVDEAAKKAGANGPFWVIG